MPMKMFDKTFFYRRNTEYVYSPPQSNIQYEDDVQKHTQPPAYDLSQWLKPKHYCSTRNVIIFGMHPDPSFFLFLVVFSDMY